jgi:hypothetical protein
VIDSRGNSADFDNSKYRSEVDMGTVVQARGVDPAAFFEQNFYFQEVCDLRGVEWFKLWQERVERRLGLQAFGLGCYGGSKCYLLATDGSGLHSEIALIFNCGEIGEFEYRCYVAPVLPTGCGILTIHNCRLLLRFPNENDQAAINFSEACQGKYWIEIGAGTGSHGHYSFGIFPGPYRTLLDASRGSKQFITARE